MKYTEQQYIDCNFYGEPGEDVIGYSAKVVKVLTDKECVFCNLVHKRGTKMLCEKALLKGEGRRSAYTCLDCLDKWLDQTGQYG